MEPILSVKDLSVSFNAFAGKVHAVRDVNFDLYKGETLAIVGEMCIRDRKQENSSWSSWRRIQKGLGYLKAGEIRFKNLIPLFCLTIIVLDRK